VTFVILEQLPDLALQCGTLSTFCDLQCRTIKSAILQPGNTTRLKTSKCVTFLCRYWTIKISFQIISSKPSTCQAFKIMNMKVLNKLISQEEDVPVS
jgi:hypothetical protein